MAARKGKGQKAKVERRKKARRAKAQRARRATARRMEAVGGLGEPTKAPYVQGSRTSQAAAESLSEKDLSWLEKKVFNVIRRARLNGLTDEEVETRTGLRHQSASARRRGLVLKGWVRDSGKVHRNQSKRWAIRWVVGREEFVTPGARSAGRPPRPSNDELKRGIEDIRALMVLMVQSRGAVSTELSKLLDWLVYLAK